MKLINSLRSAIKIGDSFRVTRTLSQKDLDAFSSLSGDHNPIHKGANSIVHGAFLNSIISGIIGTKLPGHGTLVVSQSFSFPSKCFIDVPTDFVVELVDNRKIIKVKYKCIQRENVVMDGEAKLIMNKEA